MILDNPAGLSETVPAGMRLMGLDVGTKTIGLALSDTRRVIATPLDTIRRRRFAEHRIDIADYHPLELQAMPGFR